MERTALLAWLASLPDEERDREVEARLGIGSADPTPPGEHLIGHHPSGVDAIRDVVDLVPITERDVVIDLGSGLGKVALLIKILSGATVRGIEIQPALVARAEASAARLGVDVAFEVGDVREARLDDGNVFFAYLPFIGPALAQVVARLEAVARQGPIVVVTLGCDLDRIAPWLRRRPLESFWLAVYDSVAG
jgi:SAM-dependent methyltransferase